MDSKGRLHINNRRYELPPEHARTEVQVRICGDTLEVFAGFQRVKTFNTTLGASMVTMIESSLDPCVPGFSNMVNNFFSLRCGDSIQYQRSRFVETSAYTSTPWGSEEENLKKLAKRLKLSSIHNELETILETARKTKMSPQEVLEYAL